MLLTLAGLVKRVHALMLQLCEWTLSEWVLLQLMLLLADHVQLHLQTLSLLSRFGLCLAQVTAAVTVQRDLCGFDWCFLQGLLRGQRV